MLRTPSAPAGAAEAAADEGRGGLRDGGPAPPPQTAEEAVATARAYAESVSDGVIERDRAGNAPVAELARLDASGLLAITVPRSLGGPGLGAPALAEVIRTIAAVDPAIAQVPQGHFLFCDVLAVWGTARQQRALFGEVLGALDDVGRLVLAFVRRDAPGVHVGDDWNVMGQRATVSGTATFEDVPADPGLVVRYARAFEVPQQLGARAQLVHAAIQTGIAGGALRDARAFVRTRARPFFEAATAGWAHTAGEDPHTIYRYGQLATKVRAAEALLASAAATLDEIGRVPADPAAAARGSLAVAQAKAFASDVAAEVTTDLFSLSGASATDEKYDLSRHWRNARTHARTATTRWPGNTTMWGTSC